MIKSFLGALVASAMVAGTVGQANALVLVDDNATDFNSTSYSAIDGSARSYSFNSASAGSAAFSFQLFGARSEDGVGNCCSDLFSLILNGATIFEGYFDAGTGSSNSEVSNAGGLGWTWTLGSGNQYYNGMTVDFIGSLNLLNGINTLAFVYTPVLGGNQGTGDESYALNDVTVAVVSAVPVPAALPLMATGLALLGGIGARMRRRAAA